MQPSAAGRRRGNEDVPPAGGGWLHAGPRGGPAAPASRVMVIDFASTFYFHREGANLLFGMGDPDEVTGFDTTVDLAHARENRARGRARLPALAEASIARAWAGLKMTPNAMPIIGAAWRASARSRDSAVTAFSTHPPPAALLADVITGRDPHFDLSPFALRAIR